MGIFGAPARSHSPNANYAAQQGVAADEHRRSTFGLPALATERRDVGRAKRRRSSESMATTGCPKPAIALDDSMTLSKPEIHAVVEVGIPTYLEWDSATS